MIGKCHICTSTTVINYCSLCKHWFCDNCRGKYFSRGLAAIKEMTGGVKKGCCGPIQHIKLKK